MITHDSCSASNQYVKYLGLSWYAMILIIGGWRWWEILIFYFKKRVWNYLFNFPILFSSGSYSSDIGVFWFPVLLFILNVFSCLETHIKSSKLSFVLVHYHCLNLYGYLRQMLVNWLPSKWADFNWFIWFSLQLTFKILEYNFNYFNYSDSQWDYLLGNWPTEQLSTWKTI